MKIKEKTGKKRNQGKSLEKDKPGIVLKEAPPKPTAVVDWHNAIEISDIVPEKISGHWIPSWNVPVHIPSYVTTRVRELAVEKDVTTLPCYKKLAGVHTCWTRVGPGGKADWCSWLGAHAIFDDCNEITQECHGNGIMAFAICTKWTQHSNTPAKMVFKDLAEAVQAYLELVEEI